MATDISPIIDRSQAAHCLNSPAIHIRVGAYDDIQSFYIHQDLLTTHSEFFHNALKEGSPWLEEQGTLNMPMDCPKIFEIYVQLLYTGKIPLYEGSSTNTALGGLVHTRGPKSGKPILVNSQKAQGACTKSKPARDELALLCQLYVLCEKVQDQNAKNLVTTAFVTLLKQSERYLENSHINCIYDGTPESSPMRKLIVDLFACHGRFGWIEDERDMLPSDFFYDLSVSLFR